MCGVAGYVRRGPSPRSMSEVLSTVAHRGPDAEGRWTSNAGDWCVSLGHRRLSIIDLATGAQPMSDASGHLHIVYNGELYNFRELRRELEGRGFRFQTKSDTEVLLVQVGAHGMGGVACLNGMFAFAIWDSRTRRLALGRDRAGIKPLYYAPLPCGGIAFGSELTTVLAACDPQALSIEGLASYFFADYVHAPLALAAGIRKLPPGHTLVWDDGRIGAPSAYWSVPAPAAAPRRRDTDVAAELWERLGNAVERQLVADVPVGVFLSGGLDSSSVATLASRRAHTRMKAFAATFEDATFDEGAHARRVANEIGVEFVEERFREANLVDVVDAAIDQLDEPMADPSLLPTYLLSRLAARHVKVVLSGDGGDELWGGYATYRAHRYARAYGLLPRVARFDWMGRMVDALPLDDHYQSLEWKLRRFTQRWDDEPIRRHQRWMSCIDVQNLPRALPTSGGISPLTLEAKLPTTDDELARILALDFTTYMPGSVLTKVDRASMAHGLEARPPLLDNDIIKFAFSLPSTYKLRGGTTKFLFKLAARRHLPPGIADRAKKGFGIPLSRWLRGPLADRMADVVGASPAWDTGLLDRRFFVQCHAEHSQRRVDHSKPLWALYVFDRWLRRHRSSLLLGV
jgi:asparagine synthase (glutamine-hydrolysing)